MEVSPIGEELNSVGMRPGEQSVISPGASLMLTLLADNWAMLLLVRIHVASIQYLHEVMNDIMMSAGTPRYDAFYGQGRGPILLDDLLCTNTEDRLIDCQHGGIGTTDFCRGHLDDAGLECQESTRIRP